MTVVVPPSPSFFWRKKLRTVWDGDGERFKSYYNVTLHLFVNLFFYLIRVWGWFFSKYIWMKGQHFKQFRLVHPWIVLSQDILYSIPSWLWRPCKQMLTTDGFSISSCIRDFLFYNLVLRLHEIFLKISYPWDYKKWINKMSFISWFCKLFWIHFEYFRRYDRSFVTIPLTFSSTPRRKLWKQ